MNNSINVKFGQVIKDLSRQKNRSIADLAEISGLSLDAIEKIEKGESSATVEMIIKLAEALSIHPSELFEWY